MKEWSIPDDIIDKKFISPKELSVILGLSLATIYRFIMKRKIPFHKIGNSLRFSRNDVIEYLNKHRIDLLD